MRIPKCSVLFLVSGILTLGLFSEAATVGERSLSAKELHTVVGERATVCGKVSAVEVTGNQTGPTVIEIDALRIVVHAKTPPRIGDWGKVRKGSSVCITGLVEMASNRPRIALSEPSQLRLVESGPSDMEIRRILVEESKAAYPGPCPCPESINRAGRRCGKTSAYSKPGGASPLCYPSDVTDEMVRQYRDRQ